MSGKTQYRLAIAIAIATALGLILVLALKGLSTASLISSLVAAAAEVLAIILALHGKRRQGQMDSTVQTVSRTEVDGGVTQASGVSGDFRAGATGGRTQKSPIARRALSPQKGEKRQTVSKSKVKGPIRQVIDVEGNLDLPDR